MTYKYVLHTMCTVFAAHFTSLRRYTIPVTSLDVCTAPVTSLDVCTAPVTSLHTRTVLSYHCTYDIPFTYPYVERHMQAIPCIPGWSHNRKRYLLPDECNGCRPSTKSRHNRYVKTITRTLMNG